MSGVTHFLKQIDQRDPHAAEQLLPLVYDELRKLAAARLASEKPGQTLQATALVHEAYLRLVGNEKADPPSEHAQPWDHRGHFFAAAAEAMRRILVENARRKSSTKRGGDMQRLPLAGLAATVPDVYSFSRESGRNHWVHQRLGTPLTSSGALTFYQTLPQEHLALGVGRLGAPSEKCLSGLQGSQNHWLDTLYNASAAGHLCGVRLVDEVKKPMPAEDYLFQ